MTVNPTSLPAYPRPWGWYKALISLFRSFLYKAFYKLSKFGVEAFLLLFIRTIVAINSCIKQTQNSWTVVIISCPKNDQKTFCLPVAFP